MGKYLVRNHVVNTKTIEKIKGDKGRITLITRGLSSTKEDSSRDEGKYCYETISCGISTRVPSKDLLLN